MSALTGSSGALRSGGGAGSPTFLWELVCDIDFTLEDDQALSGGNLTLTNQVTGEPVILAGQTVEVVGGALVMTAAASSNIVIVNAATRTGALLGAPFTTLWPDFDGHPVRWGAELTAAPTFDAAKAWGVLAENATLLGGGNAGAGYSAENYGTGVGTATRRTRYLVPGGSSNTVALNTTNYASGVLCGLSLDGASPRGIWSTTAGDADELDTLTPLGAVGFPGGSVSNVAVAPPTRFAVFAAASGAGAFVVSVKRLVLWARVARVAS